MKLITICFFIFVFLILKPYNMQQTGLIYPGDDYSYFAHATSIVFGQFPSYEKEHFVQGDKSPKNAIGAGLMAVPFVYIFSLVDRMMDNDIVYQRTGENLSQSWSLFGFVLASNFYFWIACFLLYKGLRYSFEHRYASLAVILVVLCQGMPLYVFRRPLFPNACEFFLQSLMVYLLLRNNYKSLNLINNYRLQFFIGITIGMIILVRYNNFLASVIWPLVLLIDDLSVIKKRDFGKAILFIYSVAAILFILFKALPDYYNQHHSGGIDFLFNLYPLSHYLRLFLHILFGIDWGLIYTAPFVIIGVIALICFRIPLRRHFLICLIPVLVNFYGSIAWGSNGGWYGYRYIIALAFPLIVLPLAFLLHHTERRFGKKINIIWALVAILPLLSMISFEGNRSNLTLDLVYIPFGVMDWSNNTYQLEVWKTLLFHPQESLIAFFKGGPVYITYLIALLFNNINKLPSEILEKYPVFQFNVAIKTFSLYLLPFFLYWAVIKNRLFHNSNLK